MIFRTYPFSFPACGSAAWGVSPRGGHGPNVSTDGIPQAPASAVTVISMWAPAGRDFTSTVVRPGCFFVKYWA